VFGTSFVLRENDYTVKGLQKFGGNAQVKKKIIFINDKGFF
jgi:hypothetical protein